MAVLSGASSGSEARTLSVMNTGLWWERVRCAIIRSNNLQVYPRNALLSLKVGLDITSMSSAVKK